MQNIILYHNNLLKFGGVDTFSYNFIKKISKYYNITFLYSIADEENLKRIEKYVDKAEKYNPNKKYTCDICICASAWGKYPDTVIATTGKYIQVVHADYIKAKEVNFEYNKWFKTTEHIGVSEHVCKVFKEMFPILKLISATRVSKEKGYSRMFKLANKLKEAGVKFRWTIFTDLNLYNQRPFNLEEIIYMKPSYDFFDYIAEADYGVQLSDTEGYSYFINECLQYGTPVISTNFPSAYESITEGENGYLLDMELSNLDIDKIVNKIPNNFKYKEKCKEEDWIKLFNKKEKEKETYQVTAKEDYEDKRPELIQDKGKIKYNEYGNAEIKKGNTYIITNKYRAEEIKESGLADVVEIKKIETAIKKVKTEKAIRKKRK